MLGGFPTLTPNIFSMSLLPWELLSTLLQKLLTCILTGWSLSLLIRATLGSRINKQGIWSGVTQMTDKNQGDIWGDPSTEAMEGSRSSRKPCPELTNPNPTPPTWELDLRGPRTKAVETSLLSAEKQTKGNKDEVWVRPTKEERGKLPALSSQGQQKHFLRVF